MNKTAVVAVGILKRHSLYPKFIRRTQKFKVHDEENQAKMGDLVEITETRPLSKEKNWRLSKIIERAK
jgi:small subunit ribosomal protein S17